MLIHVQHEILILSLFPKLTAFLFSLILYYNFSFSLINLQNLPVCISTQFAFNIF